MLRAEMHIRNLELEGILDEYNEKEILLDFHCRNAAGMIFA